MKKAQTLYVSWESTPLKWHKFLLAITPIRILLALTSTVYTFANISADIAATIQAAGGGWAYLWDIAACAVNALVPTIFFIGLLRRKWFGVTVLLLWNVLQIVFGAAGLALVGHYDQMLTTLTGGSWLSDRAVGEFLTDSLLSILWGVIHFFPNRIYYKKRRLLFSPHPFHVDTPTAGMLTAAPGVNSGGAGGTSSVDLLAQLRDECEAEQAAKQQPKLPDPRSPDRSPTALKLLCGALGCACVVLLLCCVHQAGTTERLEEELTEKSRQETYLSGRVSFLENKVQELEAESQFWANSAVISAGPVGVYHSYGCPELEEAGDYYYIYDILDAYSLGLEPCPICHPGS